MRGFSVPRKGGWDCHGLPAEVYVEKKLNIKDKSEIDEMGLAKEVGKRLRAKAGGERNYFGHCSGSSVEELSNQVNQFIRAEPRPIR